MSYFIGFDVGSSKTHALIADKAGHCLGFGRALGGNQQGVGYEGLEKVLQAALDGAVQAAGITPDQLSGAGFGIAGYDFPSDRKPHLDTISKLNLACPVDIMNDGENGLLAGTSHGIGVNVTAGSGVNCRGRGADGRIGRIVGNGAYFGEFGGGIEIVQLGLHKVNYAWIRRIPATKLTGIYLEATGARDEIDLMLGLSNGRYYLSHAITLKIFEAAREGDEAAWDIIQFSGAELGWLAVAVIRQIGMENETVEVVQSGSIFDGGEMICTPMREVILRETPKAQIKRLDCLPVVGPVMLAMQAAEVDGYAIRPNIVGSLKEILIDTNEQ